MQFVQMYDLYDTLIDILHACHTAYMHFMQMYVVYDTLIDILHACYTAYMQFIQMYVVYDTLYHKLLYKWSMRGKPPLIYLNGPQHRIIFFIDLVMRIKLTILIT